MCVRDVERRKIGCWQNGVSVGQSVRYDKFRNALMVNASKLKYIIKNHDTYIYTEVMYIYYLYKCILLVCTIKAICNFELSDF